MPDAYNLDLGEGETKADIALRGTFMWQGTKIMKTSVAAEYLVAFGMQYAAMYKSSLLRREKGFGRWVAHSFRQQVFSIQVPWPRRLFGSLRPGAWFQITKQ